MLFLFLGGLSSPASITATLVLENNHCDDREIQLLSSSLPFLVKNGLAHSTTSKYRSGWGEWVKWCSTKSGISSRPAEPFYVAIYINRIFFVKNTKGAIINALYSINWGHRVVGLASPTENSLVKLAYEGALRLIGGKVSKKDALPIEVVKDVMDKFKLSPGNLLHMRTIVVILLGFCGFFRTSELLSIKLGDMTFLPDQLKVFLDVSKCDQHRQGNTIVIARTGSRYCAVTFVEDFLKRAGLDVGKDKDSFLIPRL